MRVDGRETIQTVIAIQETSTSLRGPHIQFGRGGVWVNAAASENGCEMEFKLVVIINSLGLRSGPTSRKLLSYK